MSRTEWAETELMASDGPFLQPQGPARRGSLRDALAHVFRDRRRIALAFLVPFLVTVGLSFIPTPRYTSDASLLLRLGREYFYTPEVGDANAAAPVAYDREQLLRAEVEIVTSRDVEEAAIARVGLATLYPKLAASAASTPEARQKQLASALLDFNRNLEVLLPKDTNVVHLSFTHADPKLATAALNAVIDTYLDKRRGIFNATSPTNTQDHVASLRYRLSETEHRLDDLKRTRGIQSFPEQQTLLLAQRQNVELKLADASLALAQSAGRAASLRSSLAATPADVQLSNETQRSESVESTRKTLLDLRLKERDLTSRFTDANPSVVDVRADIARTEAFLKDLEARPSRLVKTGRSPVRDGLESDLLRSLADQGQASASNRALLVERDEIAGRLSRLASSQRELETLERERAQLVTALDSATRRLEDETVVQGLDASRKSSVKLLQAPREPLQGKSIRLMLLVIGSLVSLACALAVAFVSALWRDTFLSPDEVQRSLGLPMLAAVPRVSLG
jgi:uncharacterized protein involved in exopolysaccharide biosynthesis